MTSETAGPVRYEIPANWISYNIVRIAGVLTEAKAAMLSLQAMPFQRSWADELQGIQLKREVAGTSKIEGADFSDRELEAAMRESPNQLQTRSQRQAAAAVMTYRWIATLANDLPIDAGLILEAHRRIVSGADDDHCVPGRLRATDENVVFGSPRHRGCEGGESCKRAFDLLCDALREDFPRHDPLVQALALHYHFAAMHPFLDGNGRTARALEALVLQRTGLRDGLFIAMSNYYYEEKAAYLAAPAAVRMRDHDLTPFLEFGLRGIQKQCERLLREIKINLQKALFRNMMFSLFNRLKTPRTRVMAERQLDILKLLLSSDRVGLEEIHEKTKPKYGDLQNPYKALIRDLNYLIGIKAISYEKFEQNKYVFFARLDWPTEITETEFFARVKQLPKARTSGFLS